MQYLLDDVSDAQDSLFTRVSHLETKLEWDKPALRITVLMSYTVLFLCYSMICKIYTTVATSALRAGDDKVAASNTASFRAELRIFQNDLRPKALSHCNKFDK